ncbi:MULTISPECIES: 3'(2'),5'-bisphosphate nucleotidase CysQ [unclassified Brevundimonas]|uniref:3'(2'),5'-bisphosphate nucleotidase CysQ n=1 Tax=unclassified Brevundimonas TaxID=2622653 RepID=UPI0025C0EAA6|nr:MULTISPECIES: 3'(2'),5'-bisphosphate nucleotidase CysQ [unclassified Brevundimonas]
MSEPLSPSETPAPAPLSSAVAQRLASDLKSGRLAEIIAEIAEEAAEVIRGFWHAGVVAEQKADASPVTEADRAAERLILSRLEAEWPGVQTIAEEQACAKGLPQAGEGWFWLIDPLDGTRGFVAGREAFTVNIALVRDRLVVAGAVVAPATGISWRSGPEAGGAFRRQGQGAWQPIHVRERPAEPVALVSHSLSDEEAERLIRRHGCTRWQALDSSLKLCLIAEGRFDAYPRTGPTSEWDIAAGHGVLQAAGGRVITDDGQTLKYAKPGFANGAFVALGG